MTLTEGRLGFRLGLYEPGDEEHAELVGPIFDPCQKEALAMRDAIAEYKARATDRRIGIFIQEVSCES